ncbi:unnamed protein product [Heligmosomoides polygyrus]|uniref:Uncharacterized protein n=1 Tax=Heligmosomoides polygyrus TaxID=6339 RepID=A0A183FZR2_HELPZ|nr:unnamed protein product [Heligmosomoides polygyrus]
MQYVDKWLAGKKVLIQTVLISCKSGRRGAEGEECPDGKGWCGGSDEIRKRPKTTTDLQGLDDFCSFFLDYDFGFDFNFHEDDYFIKAL